MAGKPRGKGKPFQPGEVTNPAGRPKGVPNKITNDVRQFVLDVANRFNQDETKALDTVDKNLFWGTIFPKIIPKDINVQAQVWTRQLSDDELVKRIEQLLEKRGERA